MINVTKRLNSKILKQHENPTDRTSDLKPMAHDSSSSPKFLMSMFCTPDTRNWYQKRHIVSNFVVSLVPLWKAKAAKLLVSLV